MFLINEEEEDGNVGMENGKGRSRRSPRKFWSKGDDSYLIRAWLNTSKNGVGHFWNRITAFVNENHLIKDGPRNWKSCKNRWSTISKSVAKYVNAMAQARQRATPEMTESEIMIMANHLYHEDAKMDFHFSHAYELLQNEPKFLDAYITKKKQDVCELQPNIDDELSFSEAEASSKRPRLNEGDDSLSANNNGDDDPCAPQVQTRSLDPCTPQVQTRSLDPCSPHVRTRSLDPCSPHVRTRSLDPCSPHVRTRSLDPCSPHVRTRSLDPCSPQVQTRSMDHCTPQVETRSLGVEGQDNHEGEPMQSVGSLEEQIRSSLQVFRETNQKVDEWKEVKLKEMQINVELAAKKMEQKNRDSRYKLFNTLLGKASLSEFDEALKNKLYAELFPE